MEKKIVIAGGTGFIGQYLQKKFLEKGFKVTIISRQTPYVSWDRPDDVIQALEGGDMLINLAGKSVDCRYNEKNKADIFKSRTETTNILGKALLQCQNPPPLWVNSSTATIYRHAEDRPMTEEGGDIGTGFSVEVSKEWEKAFFSFSIPGTRQAALRIAIVLGPDGGVMTPYKNLVRFGLGGVQGPGTQRFSWIHVEDLFRIILFLNEEKELSGVFNCASPDPVTNREFMANLRNVMNKKIGLQTPKWMLEAGAVFIKTETELVLKSRWVIPERLEKAGFVFQYDTLEKALGQILAK
ncbi:TIGR01777 family oxidoreductase [Rossellomorea vietnamensis]|uniref:TIGR01777 family oxidoreductase n=1 Tax=Rossellomorea vietnamensis TaxID=218284 RepID=UPI001E4F291A|nr:TIGR01777 family oxidoreductase [Rossellomorea vietnamensis]MCC5802018.1 TIGR01777 family protein [Rossellomorea vietnamensis]